MRCRSMSAPSWRDPSSTLQLMFLVADAPPHVERQVTGYDETIRTAAHALLERHDCVVETAQRGSEAESLFRHGLNCFNYHVVISGIKLPDMSGYELMLRLKPMVQPVPLILTQEFGWDAGHTLVKARQEGLRYVLYKPFRVDQLRDALNNLRKDPG